MEDAIPLVLEVNEWNQLVKRQTKTATIEEAELLRGYNEGPGDRRCPGDRRQVGFINEDNCGQEDDVTTKVCVQSAGQLQF